MPDKHGSYIDFSDDDHLWVAHAPVSEILHLLVNPPKWVHRHVQGTDSDGNLIHPRLLRPYTISFQAIDSNRENTNYFWVQGIDGTNLLTIRIPRAGAQKFIFDNIIGPILHIWPDPLPEPESASRDGISTEALVYWLQYYVRAHLLNSHLDKARPLTLTLAELVPTLYLDRKIHLTVCTKDRAYAHLQLYPPDKTQVTERAKAMGISKFKWIDPISKTPDLCGGHQGKLMVALFHLCAAADPTSVDTVFSNNPKDPLPWGNWATDDGSPGQFGTDQNPGKVAKGFNRMNTDPLSMIIMGGKVVTTDALWEEADTDGDTEQVCEVLVAEYNQCGDSVTYCEAYSKLYTGGIIPPP